jgi:hypothetical protein
VYSGQQYQKTLLIELSKCIRKQCIQGYNIQQPNQFICYQWSFPIRNLNQFFYNTNPFVILDTQVIKFLSVILYYCFPLECYIGFPETIQDFQQSISYFEILLAVFYKVADGM